MGVQDTNKRVTVGNARQRMVLTQPELAQLSKERYGHSLASRVEAPPFMGL